MAAGERLEHADELLDAAIGAACSTQLDLLDDAGLSRRISRFDRAQARLVAERARMVAELEHRRVGRVDDPRDQERTRQQVRRELTGRSNRSPSQAKLDAQAGAAARHHGTTGRAFADGEIGAEHVRLIASALDSLPPDGDRDRTEDELLAVARTSSPTVLGRHVRALLARRAPASVALREERQQRARRFTAVETADGALSLSGLLHGSAAETVRAALEAFRRPDGRGELRTPAQRGADAIEQLCSVALRAEEAPARHGARPQVVITVTTAELELGDDGVATLASGETTTIGRLRHLLDDCSWARVVLGPDGAPLEASTSTRTVPAALWRALLARDGGCTWEGCDAPAAWCDVAHGQVPFAAGGRLAPDNAALLCRRHHRRFDHGGYAIRIRGGEVSFHRTTSAGVSIRPSGSGEGSSVRSTGTGTRVVAMCSGPSSVRVSLPRPPPERARSGAPPDTGGPYSERHDDGRLRTLRQGMVTTSQRAWPGNRSPGRVQTVSERVARVTAT